jgi:hyperosmotically inducible periplasmic protein
MHDLRRNSPSHLKSLATLCVVLFACWALASSADTRETPESPEGEVAQRVKDAWIAGRVETAFLLNPYLSPFAIETQVDDGVVTLSGTLRSDIDRDLAVEIATGIDGVARVENQLTVDPESAESSRLAGEGADERSFGQWIKDATTTARVKTRLLANNNTKGLSIKVDTRDDVVTLTGVVESHREKLLAETIARNIDGIVEVHNRIEVDEQA